MLSNNKNYLLWSAAIDLENKEIYQLLEDIIFNKDCIGKVSKDIIKSLLNSNKKEAWELVEKLLLAAQRQEGLRQTVLEALDETNIYALSYMLNVIIENKLTRFSSVVRAIDTWTGLGWEAEKENTVRKVAQKAYEYLNNAEIVVKTIKSSDNIDIYMALWAQGVLDVEKTIPYLDHLLDKGNFEKKLLALKFASETQYPELEIPLYYKALKFTDNLAVIALALKGLISILNSNYLKKIIDNPDYSDFFEKLYNLSRNITEKEKLFEGKVFSWLTIKFDKNDIFRCMIYLSENNKEKINLILKDFDNLDVSIREILAQIILKDHYCYFLNYLENNKSTEKIVTDEQRKFALQAIKDRSEVICASSINVFSSIFWDTKESNIIITLYKRKSPNLRKSLTNVVLKQHDETILYLLVNGLLSGDIEQRTAALDIMLQLKHNNKLSENITYWVSYYKERKKISKNEQYLLEQIDPSNDSELIFEKNGYKLFNPQNITPYNSPEVDKNSIYALSKKVEPYGFSQPLSSIIKKLNELANLFLENKDYEYEYTNYYGSKCKVLLINEFRCKFEQDTLQKNKEEIFKSYPLYEVWEQWYKNSKLTPQDLFILTLAESCDRKFFRDFLEKYVFYYKNYLPDPKESRYSRDNPVLIILLALANYHPFDKINEFCINACADIYANLPDVILKYKDNNDVNYYYYNDAEKGWQSLDYFDIFLRKIDLKSLTKDQVKKVWDLYRWRQNSGLPEEISLYKPPLYLYCKAYENQLITEDELYEGIIVPNRIFELTRNKKQYHYCEKPIILTKEFPFLIPIIDRIRENFLDIELKRADSSTAVTLLVQNFGKIYGINRFEQLLTGLGRYNLYNGYTYTSNYATLNKKELFSVLLKRCFPREKDTQQEFDLLIKKANLPEIRLIQAAVYAPQWQKFISSYLNWKGLDQSIWWIHAHTKTSDSQIQDSELESEIARYSTLDIQDFKDGCVDKDWFMEAYKKLGKAKWELLYDSAKYISDGNGHRRAQLYADSILGDLKIREVTAKIKDKRDQDYLRIYGLIPLSKKTPEKDLISRYEFIQQFKKESKQFGSMKQASEGLAIRVSLENLARNSGHPDPIRLTWAMESEQIKNILSKETQIQLENVTIKLTFDEEGIANVISYKDNKALKSIPSKFKKDKKVLELLDYSKTLHEQHKRSRKGLEEAMIRGDEFTYHEIINLFENIIISKHLEKLVFITESETGFYRNKKLINAENKEYLLQESDKIRIAHCYDLHKTGTWSAYQSYCFEHQIKQPFKQIFRELYVPTPDELQEKSVSRRYAGHQVNPKQTLSILKTRGWKVDYDEGLQKVYHKEGFVVKLYAMMDWFSPSDIENPTLETIEFHYLKDYKNVFFTDIEPRIFSEVMRDIDLVVSIAHAGDVDPQASHSSIELRSLLVKETISLFKLKNVKIIGSHVKIKGNLGEYSIHLGSATVHIDPGKYLSILPIHSQHRGRIFLPFADDDPKSAEVISKVLLLAKDNEIQDPTILTQIQS